jgi:hypothetical protein
MNNTQKNIDAIREQIRYKNNYNLPYYPTRYHAESVLTDQDHFPYKRYFRGVYNESRPVIIEREAGFMPLHNDCYRDMSEPTIVQQKYCWQYPCSTVYPCSPPENELPSGQENVSNSGKCKKPHFIISP